MTTLPCHGLGQPNPPVSPLILNSELRTVSVGQCTLIVDECDRWMRHACYLPTPNVTKAVVRWLVIPGANS